MLEIGVLGPLVARLDGVPLELGGPKQRAVLAVLVGAGGRVVPFDRLVDDLWGEDPPPAATSSVQAYVSHLRRLLEPGRNPRTASAVLVTVAPGYAVRTEQVVLDAHRFAVLRDEAEEHLARGELLAARTALEAAEALWRGPAYGEFEHLPALRPEIERLRELRLQGRERLGEVMLGAGDHRGAVVVLEALVADAPLRERAHELLMLALYRSGRQADALRVASGARRHLAEELGLEPGPALRQLEQRVLAQDPTLAAPTAAAAPDAWAAPAPTAPVTPPPGPVPARPGSWFVGRDRELATLLDAAAAARAGARVAVVGGEPGIGKTRLVEELAERLAEDGWTVAWGRGHDDESAPALWPLAGVLRAVGARSLAELAGGDGETRTWALFDTIVGELRAAARRGPLCVVLDDLQWADRATLRWLPFAAVELGANPVLVVATVRTTEVGEDAAAALAAVARAPGAIRLELQGLDVHAVATFVQRSAGTAVGAEVAAGIHARTGGNPFFAGELARLLASERRLDGSGVGSDDVPAAVRDVVGRRVARLSEETATVLTLAAVAGPRVDLDDLELAGGVDADTLADALDAAVVAGLLRADGTGADLRFSHALVQEALVASLAPRVRARLHRRVLEAVASRRGAEGRAGEVLHHALRAGDQVAVARWAPVVAAQAEALGAFADAAAAWGHASGAARRVGAPAGELLTATVGAVRDHRLAGHLSASREALDDALAAAEALGTPEAAAAVADALIGISVWPSRPYGEFDPELPALLERALGWLAPDDHVHRARLCGALAVERYYEPGRPERGAADGRAAVAAARQAGGVATLGLALHAFMLGASATPVTEEWLAAADELVSLEGPDLPAELGWVGRVQRVVGRLGLDRPIDVRAEVALCAARAEQLRQPLLRVQSMWMQGMVAALDDDHAAAMAVVAGAVPLHAALGFTDPGAQVLLLEVDHRLAHGGLGELHDQLAAAAEVSEFPAVRLFAALAALDAGELVMARTHLEAAGWAPAHDFLWLAHLVLAAEVAAALRHPSMDAIAEVLAPLADGVVVVGTAVMCWGSLHHFVGILAAARGDQEGARTHLARAVEVNERLGVRRWARRSAEALAALG